MLIALIAVAWTALMMIFLAVCKVAAHGDLSPVERGLVEVEAGIFVHRDELTVLGITDQRPERVASSVDEALTVPGVR
jgi:hypothetical protein